MCPHWERGDLARLMLTFLAMPKLDDNRRRKAEAATKRKRPCRSLLSTPCYLSKRHKGNFSLRSVGGLGASQSNVVQILESSDKLHPKGEKRRRKRLASICCNLLLFSGLRRLRQDLVNLMPRLEG